MAGGFHLAQVNIGRTKAPLDSEQLSGFVEALEPVNALADAAPGFVWRLQTDEGDATSIKAFDDELMIVNMSVGEDADSLWDFVYSGEHLAYMRRRREWFERMKLFMTLWWVPAGHEPTVDEAKERLAHLEKHGPTAHAFTFKQRFPAPEGDQVERSASLGATRDARLAG